MSRYRIAGLAGLAAFMGIAVGAVVLAAERGWIGEGNQLPPLTVPQDAEASASGVTFRVSKAEFSGTSTFVELTVSAPAGATVARIRSDGFSADSLKPASASGTLELPVGVPVVIRLRPIIDTAAPALAVAEVLLARTPGEAEEAVDGAWRLDLHVPADIGDRLWIERLAPGLGSSEAGITVEPVGAIRSVNETLVTVAMSGAETVSDLLIPTIEVDGTSAGGSLVERDRVGGTMVFSFPSTPRGSELELELGDLIRTPDGGDAGYLDLALGDVMRRNGIDGDYLDRVSVTPPDVSGPDGTPYTITEIDFARTSSDVNGANVIGIRVTGTFANAREFRLQLADGTSLAPEVATSSFGTDAGGNTAQGSTRLAFPFEQGASLNGTVRLTLGVPSEVVRGSWKVTFEPEP